MDQTFRALVRASVGRHVADVILAIEIGTTLATQSLACAFVKSVLTCTGTVVILWVAYVVIAVAVVATVVAPPVRTMRHVDHAFVSAHVIFGVANVIQTFRVVATLGAVFPAGVQAGNACGIAFRAVARAVAHEVVAIGVIATGRAIRSAVQQVTLASSGTFSEPVVKNTNETLAVSVVAAISTHPVSAVEGFLSATGVAKAGCVVTDVQPRAIVVFATSRTAIGVVATHVPFRAFVRAIVCLQVAHEVVAHRVVTTETTDDVFSLPSAVYVWWNAVSAFPGPRNALEPKVAMDVGAFGHFVARSCCDVAHRYHRVVRNYGAFRFMNTA